MSNNIKEIFQSFRINILEILDGIDCFSKWKISKWNYGIFVLQSKIEPLSLLDRFIFWKIALLWGYSYFQSFCKLIISKWTLKKNSGIISSAALCSTTSSDQIRHGVQPRAFLISGWHNLSGPRNVCAMHISPSKRSSLQSLDYFLLC